MRIKNLSEIKGFEKFDNYNICENGQLFNSTTKKMLQGFKNKYGYITHTLSNTPVSLTIAAHRLVALAFIENDNALIKTDVHHIDNDPSNNHINNLEWVSKSENIRQQKRKKRNNTKCYVIAEKIDTKEYETFESIIDASKSLNINYNSIYQCYIENNETAKGYRFYFNEKVS